VAKVVFTYSYAIAYLFYRKMTLVVLMDEDKGFFRVKKFSIRFIALYDPGALGFSVIPAEVYHELYYL
jgi:hypothetical protein